MTLSRGVCVRQTHGKSAFRLTPVLFSLCRCLQPWRSNTEIESQRCIGQIIACTCRDCLARNLMLEICTCLRLLVTLSSCCLNLPVRPQCHFFDVRAGSSQLSELGVLMFHAKAANAEFPCVCRKPRPQKTDSQDNDLHMNRCDAVLSVRRSEAHA